MVKRSPTMVQIRLSEMIPKPPQKRVYWRAMDTFTCHSVVLSDRLGRLLKHLMDNPGRVIPRQEILQRVFPTLKGKSNSVVVAISGLRVALTEITRNKHHGLIHTVKHEGYRWGDGVPQPQEASK